MKTLLMANLRMQLILATVVAITFNASVDAQIPSPAPEMDVLKRDVGEWDCEIRTWSAPGAEPMVTKGKESSRMLGGHWLITDFEGNMMGLDFKGHGTYGYDSGKKKYIGTWVDSMGPYMMQTEGTYDTETETLTVAGEAPGPDGKSTFTYTMVTRYKGKNRVMTMFMQPKGSGDDQKMKFFEITYTKRKLSEN